MKNNRYPPAGSGSIKLSLEQVAYRAVPEAAVRVTSATRIMKGATTAIGKRTANVLNKKTVMAKTHVRREDNGHGADFINERRAVDDAINERMKSENERDKLDPRSANNKNRAEYDPDGSTKKTGRTKH